MKYLLTILLIGLTITSSSQNLLILNGAFARPGDTIIVSVNITNADKFISFQFDLPLPDQVSFLGYSIHMSERSTNHVAVGNMVGANLLRIFSYSPNNSAFLGNSGEVVSFKLVIGIIRGEFPMNPENCIIGDSLSRNIITGTENGILSVFPLALEDRTEDAEIVLEAFPNPAKEQVTIQYRIAEASDVNLSIYDMYGRLVKRLDIGPKQPGKYTTEWATTTMPPGTYICRLNELVKRGNASNTEIKIILRK